MGGARVSVIVSAGPDSMDLSVRDSRPQQRTLGWSEGGGPLPESRHRYLYERLGDHDFQQLVSALLASQFPAFIPMALRQADGGT